MWVELDNWIAVYEALLHNPPDPLSAFRELHHSLNEFLARAAIAPTFLSGRGDLGLVASIIRHFCVGLCLKYGGYVGHYIINPVAVSLALCSVCFITSASVSGLL